MRLRDGKGKFAMETRQEMLARFEANYIPEPNTGCWLWLGEVVDYGYGRFWYNNKKHNASRFSYKIFKGEIVAGLETDHLCCTPCCVNPNHLELVSRAENMRRRGRATIFCRRCREKLSQGKTQKFCKVCHNERNQQYRQRLKEQ